MWVPNMNVIYRALCFLLALCGSYGCSDSSDFPSGNNLLLMQAEAEAMDVLEFEIEARNKLDAESLSFPIFKLWPISQPEHM